MTTKSPFATYDDKVEESFGDLAYLDHPDPSFVREDFDPNDFAERQASNETTESEKTAVVVPSLVTLARAYMWDRLPGGYAVYNDKDSSGDIESFDGEKRTWRPLSTDTDPDPARPQRPRSSSVSSCRTDAPHLEEDDPRITGIPPNNDDIKAWRRVFKEETGMPPTAEDEANFFTQQSTSDKYFHHRHREISSSFASFYRQQRQTSLLAQTWQGLYSIWSSDTSSRGDYEGCTPSAWPSRSALYRLAFLDTGLFWRWSCRQD